MAIFHFLANVFLAGVWPSDVWPVHDRVHYSACRRAKSQRPSRLTLLLLALIVIGAVTCEPLSRPWGEFVVPPGQPVRIGVAVDLDAAPSEGLTPPSAGLLPGATVAGHPIEQVPIAVHCQATTPAAIAPDPAAVAGLLGFVGGGCSSACVYAEGILFDEKTTMVAAGCTAAAVVQQGFPTAFRLAWDDNDQGVVAANYIASNLGARRAVVVGDDSSYSRSLTAAFAARFREEGGSATEVHLPVAGSNDESRLLARIGSAQPSAIFLAVARTDAAEIFMRLQSDLPAVTTIASDTVLANPPCSDETLLSPSLCSSSVQPPTGLLTAGLMRAADGWASELALGATSPSLFSGQQNDAIRLYAAALAQVAHPRPDGSVVIGRQQLRDAIAKIRISGETGRIDFGAGGERQHDVGAAVYQLGPDQPLLLRSLER